MNAREPRRGRPLRIQPRAVQPPERDPYRPAAKHGQAVVCEHCGLVGHAGRWYRGAPPESDVHRGLCPACRRVSERSPAGTIRLAPRFLQHRGEIHALAENAARAEGAEHPLERLMGVEESAAGLLLTTTGIHLARRIAHDVERRFHADARFHYVEDQAEVQVEVD